MDADKLSSALVEGAKRYVDAALGPLVARIKELEARPVPAGIVSALKNESGVLVLTLSDGKALETGIRDGEAVYPDGSVLERMVAEEVAKLPPAEKGKDGKDADPEQIAEAVKAEVAALPRVSREEVEGIVGEAIKAIPAHPEGPTADEIAEITDARIKDAVSALPASPDLSVYIRGEVLEGVFKDLSERIDGCVLNVSDVARRHQEQIEQVAAGIPAAVQEAVEKLPPAEPGKSVTPDDVRPMLEEIVAKAVAGIPPAKDGVGLAGAVIDRDGNLVLTLSDGKGLPLGRVVGEPGQPGRDGFGFEDMKADFDGERTVTFRWTKGEHSEEFSFALPVPLDRGVWREGTYEKGDFVSFGGSGFIAQRKTSDKPETSDAWRLSVKRGRDGKDGTVKQIPSGPVQIGPGGKEKK